ncbi:hypothetical protein GCM10027418_20020 [Mariniluteicoccus endophyticus]
MLAVSPVADRLMALGGRGVQVMGLRPWVRVPALGFSLLLNTPRLRERLAAAFTRHRIGMVHVHSEFGLASAAVAAARGLGLPVVATVHTFFWQGTREQQLPIRALAPFLSPLITGRKLLREPLADRAGDSVLRNVTLATARAVDQVVSPSAHQARMLERAGSAPVTVVPNTVPDAPDARPLDAVHGPLRVLWTGRFAAEKRILPFVAAARAAVDEVGPERLRVDLVGTGPQHAEAVALGAGEGLTFHGRVAHDEIPGWIARSHVTALSSVGWDNQPMTVAESVMGCRGVVYCDERLTEGLDAAGIPAFGDDTVLRDRLVELACDPAPVVDASRRALTARTIFGRDAFVTGLAEAYARATRAAAGR